MIVCAIYFIFRPSELKPLIAIEQLKALTKKTDEAFINGDAAALAALYTDDAVLMNDKGPIYGREAIEQSRSLEENLAPKPHSISHARKRMTRMKTIALIDTRLEVPGVSLGILVSTHPNVMAAFAANDAFQKAEASGRHIRTKIVTLKDRLDVGQSVQPAHLAESK